MSHLHIPDGVMPLWIIAAGWALTAALLALAVRTTRQGEERRLPLLGVMAALMLVGMSLELVPIGYHINLTVIAGIVLGPALGFIAAFLVNLILAFFGHGGITVVGLNTLVIGAEMALGYYLFHGFRSLLRDRVGVGWEAAATTLFALATSTLLMIGIVALSNVNPAEAAPEASAVEPGTLTFRNPFGEGLLRLEAFPEHEAARSQLDLATFAKLVLGLGAIGWTLEAVITGLLASYVALVRPDLVAVTPRAPPG